jgi:CheY-like chemotaxis protein
MLPMEKVQRGIRQAGGLARYYGIAADSREALMPVIEKARSENDVVMISGESDIEIAVNAIKNGAFDFIEKPFNRSNLDVTLKNALADCAQKKQNRMLVGGAIGAVAGAVLGNNTAARNAQSEGSILGGVYIAGGIRGMERGTLSEEREADGREKLADMELLRLALPRRVFTLSQVMYVADRMKWLHANRHLEPGKLLVERKLDLRVPMTPDPRDIRLLPERQGRTGRAPEGLDRNPQIGRAHV